VQHPKLLKVIEMMEENLEEPLSRSRLAADAGLSTRQLERLFRKYLNRSPARYYLELRLNKARLLLLQTNMSIIDVALACGFVSASHFSKCYRDFFGRTPRKERGLPAEFGPAVAGAAT
jgi:transcriptional regulator GlxA family with amidase domain